MPKGLDVQRDGAGQNLAAEERVLLVAARPTITPLAKAQLRALLGAGIDWSRLLDAAAGHALEPLLYRTLRATGADTVPAATLARLRERCEAQARRGLLLTGELLRLLPLLKAGGVQAVPWKGPVLAALAHGDLSLRTYLDLDLLVRWEEFPVAGAVLTKAGYAAAFPLSPARLRGLRRSRNECIFVGRDNGILVDLHWEIVTKHSGFTLFEDGFWENLETARLAGERVAALGHEDLLISLCVHGAKHRWKRIGWIADVAALLERLSDLRWTRLLRRTRRIGAERMLLLGVWLAVYLLDAPAPPLLRGRLAGDRVVARLGTSVCAAWTAGAPDGAEHGGEGILSLFHLRVRERWRDRVGYCLGVALTPSVYDWQSLPLPEPLFPLYYLLRPVRLLRKYGPALLSRKAAADRQKLA